MSLALAVGGIGEHGLIERLRRLIPPPPDWVRVGIGDDAAVVEPGRREMEVLTTDALVEGVHFDRRFVGSSDLGARALAVNLSDIAAMGARPRAALVSLGLPVTLPLSDFDGILSGLVEMARGRVAIVGGNLTRSPGPLFVDVTLTGTVHTRRVLRRSGARAGDALYVSGSLGGASAGLAWLQDVACRLADATGEVPDDAAIAEAVTRYRRPEPRLRLGLLVGRNRAASACIDLSDGLADAVSQLASASGTGALVEAEALPIHPAAAALLGDRAVAAALSSDDYELLFAVPARRGRLFEKTARSAGHVPVTRIGLLTREPGVRLREGRAEGPMPSGYQHLA